MLENFKIGNAAGTCNTCERPEHFEKLLKSATDIVTVGPMSVLPRNRNTGNNAYRDPLGRSINSMGLPNKGKDWFCQHLPEMIERTTAVGKMLALTVPPINPGDVGVLAQTCADLRVPIVEINAGCNHVFDDGGTQKIPLSYYPEELGQAIATFVKIAGGTCRLRVKLSPFLPIVPGAVANAIRPHEIEVVSCNTAGNSFMFDDNFRPAIEFGKHLGGFGGTGMKPIALGQVAQLRELLPDHRIIGVGGVTTGRDAWEFLKVGADEVQVGSDWYFSENARIFSDIQAELVNILEEHPI